MTQQTTSKTQEAARKTHDYQYIHNMIKEYNILPIGTYNYPNIKKYNLYIRIENAMRSYDLKARV